MQTLAFADAGYGKREQVQAGEARTLTLSSVGLGTRWRANQHIMLSVDVGVVANGAGGAHAGDGHVHANLTVR